MNRLRLPARMESLETFRSFVIQSMKQWDREESLVRKAELVLEEVLTNIVKYAYPGLPGEIEVACFMDAQGRFCMEVQDWGNPFNPNALENPEVSGNLMDRPIGGLGVYLVKQMVKEMHYKRQDARNILELRF